MKSCMSGRSVELCEDGDGIAIRFPFDPNLVTVVRTLPARRFDQLAKCWRCPLDAIVAVVDTLLPHAFAVGESARARYVAQGGRRPFPADQPPVDPRKRSCPPA